MQTFHEVTMTFKTQLMKAVPLKCSCERLSKSFSLTSNLILTQNTLRYNKIYFNLLPACTAATAVKAIRKGLWQFSNGIQILIPMFEKNLIS